MNIQASGANTRFGLRRSLPRPGETAARWAQKHGKPAAEITLSDQTRYLLTGPALFRFLTQTDGGNRGKGNIYLPVVEQDPKFPLAQQAWLSVVESPWSQKDLLDLLRSTDVGLQKKPSYREVVDLLLRALSDPQTVTDDEVKRVFGAK